MSKRQAYADQLAKLEDWDSFLQSESGLPGPRGNLELAAAFADVAPGGRIIQYAQLTATDAPENTPMCFLAFCGVCGLGRLIAEGDSRHLELLRARAGDPRWRIREAVAMALQRMGEVDMPALVSAVDDWRLTPYERRAAIAGLCEPRLLEALALPGPVFEHLHDATRWLEQQSQTLTDGAKVLRKGLAYAWSVAVCAHPAEGKPAMETWMASPSPNVRWVMKQNLGKSRLSRLDSVWVERWLPKVS